MSIVEDIFDFRNSLVKKKTAEQVIEACVQAARTYLQSQSSSIYLLDKFGYLKRVRIAGVDVNGMMISQEWFEDDTLLPGESFTGKVVTTTSESGFGKPFLSNNLDVEVLNNNSRFQYTQKLGELRCAAAVPLNGRNRTFGVLEIINKVGDGIVEAKFTNEDMLVLALLGICTSTALSSLRRRSEIENLAAISNRLIRLSREEVRDSYEIYELVAKDLVSDSSPHNACVIRIANSKGFLDLVALEVGEGVRLDGRSLEPVGPQEDRIVTKVYKTGEAQIIHDIGKDLSRFTSTEWITINDFKSFACFPLKTETSTFGTLSVYTNYKHSFSNLDQYYIKTVLHLLAVFVESAKVHDELLSLESLRIQNAVSVAREAGYLSSQDSLAHTTKGILDNIYRLLDPYKTAKTDKKDKIVSETLKRIEDYYNEVSNRLEDIEYTQVNINHVIQETVKYFKNFRDIYFDIQFDNNIPDIEAVHSEIYDIIFNLISNAVRAIRATEGQAGVVSVLTSLVSQKGSDYVIIKVSDTGVGIPKEIDDLIYQPKFTTTQEMGGTGIGLFTVKRLVDKYNGEVRHESTVGVGTTFEVKFSTEFFVKHTP